VPAGDARALALAIDSLAADRARRASIARDGAVYAATCSWDRIFDELVSEYLDVIASDAGVRG